MKTTKLMEGKVPPGAQCPFHGVCKDADTTCNHKGERHPTPYSCGTARAFDTFLGLPSARTEVSRQLASKGVTSKVVSEVFCFNTAIAKATGESK